MGTDSASGLGVGFGLELLVLACALLWAARPDGDIGSCDDVCAGDRSTEAIFGGAFFGGAIAGLVVLVALSELTSYLAWRAGRRLSSSRRVPRWLSWAGAAVPVLLIALIVTSNALVRAAHERDYNEHSEARSALGKAHYGANVAGESYLPVEQLQAGIRSMNGNRFAFRIVRPGEQPAAGVVGLVADEMAPDRFVAVYTERDGDRCEMVADHRTLGTITCNGEIVAR